MLRNDSLRVNIDLQIYTNGVNRLVLQIGSCRSLTSVTRFGEITPLWQIFQNLWQYI